MGQVLICRCALTFPPCLHTYNAHRHYPRAACNGKVLQCQKSHCELSATMFGLVHSKSKTIKDKAVSVSSVPQLCLSLDGQTPLSRSRVWARHKIFRTACKLHSSAITVTAQIVENRGQRRSEDQDYTLTVVLRPTVSFKSLPAHPCPSGDCTQGVKVKPS